MTQTLRNVLSLLDARGRRDFAIVAVLTLATGIAELAGVVSVLPFLAVVADPAVIERRETLAALYDFLGADSPTAFLRVLGAMTFVVVMTSIAVRAAATWSVARFERETAVQLSERLLRRYLAQPYEWFLSQRAADLGKSLLSEVSQVVGGSVAPAMRLMTNGFVTALLVALLIWLEPVAALVGGLALCAAFGVVYVRLRRRLSQMGLERRAAARDRLQAAQEALNGVKAVKIHGLEEVYVNRFLQPTRKLTGFQATMRLLGALPLHMLEALSFGGMLLFVLWLLDGREARLDEALPVMGAFAFAAVKLLPALQALFRDVAQVRANTPALRALCEELAETPGAPPATAPRDLAAPRDAIRLEGVRYRYPGADADSLCDVDLEIPANAATGLVGATGAGKSTVVDLVLGLLRPAAGRVSVDGATLDEGAARAWRSRVGYVPQSVFLTPGDVASNIAFGDAGPPDMAAVERAARLAHLHDFVAGLPQGYATEVGDAGVRLSGGQRQRVGIARALYHDPDVVVFDEATSALDAVTERAVMEAVGALSGRKTVIVITHRLSAVRGCDRIYLLRKGRVAAVGRYETLVAESNEFRAMTAAAE
jgi:ABC-type multidrug transport system fused ATPase/permease subunit